MDLKKHILRWERAIEENNAVLILAVFIAVAVVFILAILIDGILKRRRDKKRFRR